MLFFAAVRPVRKTWGKPKKTKENMFFLVFVLFTSHWSVRKVLDCFFNMHLCAKTTTIQVETFSQNKSATLHNVNMMFTMRKVAGYVM